MAKSLRLEYGKHLARLGKKYPNLVALEADLKESTQSVQFEQAYPRRYIEFGVAEQNMVCVAAGLALGGKIPIHSFACFISMRACEQIRTSIAYPKLNVKFMASHAGVSAGTAGVTHHAIEDIAIMRAIPNMTVLAPGDAREVREALEVALEHKGPVYIRISASEVEDVYMVSHKFSIGKASELRKGNDLAIITTGTMVHEGVLASDTLKREFGINARVLQIASIKPIDRDSIIKAAKETGCVLTIEEHNIIGGLGSAVCEIVSEIGNARVKRIGITDHFCEVGSFRYLMKSEGLITEMIVKKALDFKKNEAWA